MVLPKGKRPIFESLVSPKKRHPDGQPPKLTRAPLQHRPQRSFVALSGCRRIAQLAHVARTASVSQRLGFFWVWLKIKAPGIGPQVLVLGSIY